MGFNTTVLILNDYLDAIEKDKDFGTRLAQAVHEATTTRPVEVRVGNALRSALVISSHSSYAVLPVLVGGNTGWPLACTLNMDSTKEVMELELLKKLAEKHGYSLRKRPK